MTRLRLILAATALSLCGQAALADVAACRALYAALPETVLGLDHAAQRDFESEMPGLGYASAFAGEGELLTMFLFDLGQSQISSELVAEHLVGAIEDMRDAAEERGFPIGELTRFPGDDGVFYAIGLIGETGEAGGSTEILAIGVRDDCIVKARYTSVGPASDKQSRFAALARAVTESF